MTEGKIRFEASTFFDVPRNCGFFGSPTDLQVLNLGMSAGFKVPARFLIASKSPRIASQIARVFMSE
jgi:hypothetical protein